MPIRVPDPDIYPRATNRLRELGYLRESPPTPPAPAALRNLTAAATLDDDDRMSYAGVEYVVPPVPVPVALRLARLQQRIAALSGQMGDDAAHAELEAICDAVAAECRAHVRPVRRWRRVAWRFLSPEQYNPFVGMTGEDLGGLLGFFSARAMTTMLRPGATSPAGRAGRATLTGSHRRRR